MYKIFIPSFNRSKKLKNTTLKLLKKYKVPNYKIIIFLENDEQYEEYFKELFHNYEIVITNTKGIMEKRNFMKTYQRDKRLRYVVNMDDDIEKIWCMKEEIKDLDFFIRLAFKTTKSKNLNYWGINPSLNNHFLYRSVSTNLNYICGAFNGTILNMNKNEIHCDIDHFEDYLFSCEYFLRDGGVVRFNNIGLQTKILTKGGICDSLGGLQNRKKTFYENGMYLINRYPDMLSLSHNKHGYNLRVNNRFKIKNSFLDDT